MHIQTSAEAAARDLAQYLEPGQIFLPGSPEYEAIKVWNSAIENHAAVVVRPSTAAGVQASVRVARALHLPLSVLGGGHDWAGRALRPGAVVIDMSGMRRVTVDAAARIGTVGGGATSADTIAATSAHGLVAATGVVGEVGVTGLTLGGGYGPISGMVGLALDNLVGADVVLADGRLVTADATHEPELFWALRGGGGNFGVVTSMRLRLHPLDNPLVGFFLFPFAQATQVLQGFAEILRTAPDELTVQSGSLPVEDAGPTLEMLRGFAQTRQDTGHILEVQQGFAEIVRSPQSRTLPAEDANATLFLSPIWSGETEAGERVINAIRNLGTPVVAQVGRMPYTALLQLFDASIVPGRSYTIETRTVPALLPEVISAIVTAGNNRTSPASTVLIHHFHGAASRVPLESTAFGIRRDHLVIEIIGAWDPGDPDPARHRVWADQFSAALAPYALPGGYANLLGPHDYEQIEHAYGPNAARLLAANRRYDPHEVFTAIPLPHHPSPHVNE